MEQVYIWRHPLLRGGRWSRLYTKVNMAGALRYISARKKIDLERVEIADLAPGAPLTTMNGNEFLERYYGYIDGEY